MREAIERFGWDCAICSSATLPCCFVLGAADVALTEALVGTLLAVTLYAVAVRSSLVLRLGVLKDDAINEQFKPLLNEMRSVFRKRHMQVELISYPEADGLHQALIDKEVHAICDRSQQHYQTTTRLNRLYEIMQTELTTAQTRLLDPSAAESQETHP